MRLQNSRFLFRLFLLGPLVLLSACGNWHTEPVYPTKITGSDKILYTDQDKDSVFGTPAAHPVPDKDSPKSAPARNEHLWKAALDSVVSLPVASIDAPHGIILTDWYENPDSPGKRLKFAIRIYDTRTGADSVDVSAFRQVKQSGEWRDTKAPDEAAANLKNDIIARGNGLRSSN